jgi:hypothetical protein
MPRITSTFTLKPGTGRAGFSGGGSIFDCIDSNGVTRDMSAAAVLAWVRHHLERNALITLVATTETKEGN